MTVVRAQTRRCTTLDGLSPSVGWPVMMPNRMPFVIFEEKIFLERQHILQAGCKRREYLKISSGVRDLAVKE